MQPNRTAEIAALLDRRILILDGAMGTQIQERKLSETDFRGPASCGLGHHAHDLKGDNDLLSVTQPDVVRAIHDAYFAAGADIVETNTFSATSIAQADYGLAARAHEMNRAAAALARERADAWTARTPERPRFVAGALGRPTAPRRSRPTSTIPRRATSRSTSSRGPTATRPPACATAASTCCSSRPCSTRSTRRPRCSASRRCSRSAARSCR
jgi:methionine synthase I (cobalamin-dependent)